MSLYSVSEFISEDEKQLAFLVCVYMVDYSIIFADRLICYYLAFSDFILV